MQQPPPTHILVTCPHCGHENLFQQPHPYHAGYLNQGFLYSEAGDCTLIWNSFDRDYGALVGNKPPWALSPADQAALEERLLPAPDSTRWLFRNPARCRRCREPISGPITDTAYYLRYDGSADCDWRSGPGESFKNALWSLRPPVPWTMRDVWLGMAVVVVITACLYGITFLLVALGVRPNLDLYQGVFLTIMQLLFLVPVWWFVKHKHHASLKTLGLRKFKVWVAAAAVGLLFAYYFLSGFYAYLLSLFGLEMQPDLGPAVEQLSTPWPLVFSVVIVAPLVEEIFFRGFVFTGLRARMDWRWAAVISSALFAAMHVQLWAFIPLFSLGFLFAFLYQKSDSVWPGIIMHFLVNALAMTVTLVWL